MMANNEKAIPSPVKVIPIGGVESSLDGHKIVESVSWTQQVPEKIKTVLWNIKSNSAALVFFIQL